MLVSNFVATNAQPTCKQIALTIVSIKFNTFISSKILNCEIYYVYNFITSECIVYFMKKLLEMKHFFFLSRCFFLSFSFYSTTTPLKNNQGKPKKSTLFKSGFHNYSIIMFLFLNCTKLIWIQLMPMRYAICMAYNEG